MRSTGRMRTVVMMGLWLLSELGEEAFGGSSSSSSAFVLWTPAPGRADVARGELRRSGRTRGRLHVKDGRSSVELDTSIDETMLASQHTHEFWSQAQSAESIRRHVASSLRSVRVASSPSSNTKAMNDVDADALSPPSTTAAVSIDVLSSDPPLVMMHNFLTPTECDQIMAAGAVNGLQRSTTGATQVVGTGRTSSTAWVRDDECSGPLRRIASQLSAVSGLPPSHMENLQVCRYLPGQEFKLHTDHQDSFNDLECRGRLATCLIYLSGDDNDNVDSAPSSLTSRSTPTGTSSSDSILPRGGETWFPGIRSDQVATDQGSSDDGLSITPRRGSAVFFWNTLEKPGFEGYHPHMFLNTDNRLRHAGLPVTSGEKWICNRWIHPIDFGAGVRGV